MTERAVVTSGIRFSRRAAQRLIDAHLDEYLGYLKEVDDVARAKQNERGKERYRRIGRPGRAAMSTDGEGRNDGR